MSGNIIYNNRPPFPPSYPTSVPPSQSEQRGTKQTQNNTFGGDWIPMFVWITSFSIQHVNDDPLNGAPLRCKQTFSLYESLFKQRQFHLRPP